MAVDEIASVLTGHRLKASAIFSQALWRAVVFHYSRKMMWDVDFI
jgi:hypothetical protein